MKNYAALLFSTAVLLGTGFGLTSCKEDEPPVPPKLSFAESEMTVSENAGVIEVELVLDKAYGNDLNVEYNLSGTASDQDAVGSANADYEVVGTHGVVVIESGQTSAVIELEIYNDGAFEEDETIEISILDVNTSDVQVTADDEVTVTITNDDTQAVASFASTSMTVNEADGTDLVQIVVQLDNPAAQQLTIPYALDGSTADDSLSAWNDNPQLREPYDYYIHTEGTPGELVIPAGATTGTIEIQVVSDLYFEDDETIQIELISSEAATIGTNNTMTVTVEQENGRIIALFWDPSYTDVDMDMFLWIGDAVDNLTNLFSLSARLTTELKEEVLFLPTILLEQFTEPVAFGLSYTYYEGTADPMNFEVHFVDFMDGAVEAEVDRDLFAATYTAANINRWDETNAPLPEIVQTFRVVDGGYADLTDITVPDQSSRIRTMKIPAGTKKQTRSGSVRLDF